MGTMTVAPMIAPYFQTRWDLFSIDNDVVKHLYVGR